MMKKNILIFLIAIILLFPNSVNAANRPYSNSYWNDCVDNNKCVPLCGYTNTNDIGAWGNSVIEERSSYIYLNLEDNTIYVDWLSQETDINYALHTQNIDHKYVKFTVNARNNLINNGKCPANSFVDFSGFGVASEVCFDDTDEYCRFDGSDAGTKFEGSSVLEYNYEDHITQYFNEWVFGDFECKDFTIDKVSDKLSKDFNINFLYGNGTPKIILNSSAYKNGMSEESLTDKLNSYKSKCVSEIQNDSTLTEEEKEQYINNFEYTQGNIKNEIEEFEQYGASNSINITNKPLSCKGILTEQMTIVVQNIFSFIKYLGPVLVGVFTIIDYIKAVLSGEPDDMKKASKRFSKRAIAAILLFFIPTIINIIFNLTGIVSPSNCFN